MDIECSYRRLTAETSPPWLDAFYGTLPLPMDDMWQQAIIGPAIHRVIMIDGIEAGFFTTDEENRLLVFYLLDRYRSSDEGIFNRVIEDHQMEEGFVSTLDTWSLPLLLDRANAIEPHTLLFQHLHPAEEPHRPANLARRSATKSDLAGVLDYHENHLGAMQDWVGPYYEGLIEREQLFLYHRKGVLIATGEIREDNGWSVYAHLGVSVSTEHRRRGLATWVLKDLTGECLRSHLRPIASTTVENTGSRCAVEGAGFHAGHRIWKIRFRR